MPIRLTDKTKIMGVINITPDSFSDGGMYLDAEKALKKASDCISLGADIIDIGGQSTRPGAEILAPDQELKRISPALKLIRKKYPKQIISVDTFYSEVAKEVLKLGANWINDVSGGRFDPLMFKELAGKKVPIVITHSRGNSQNMKNFSSYKNIVADVHSELLLQVEKAISIGVSSDQIIIDPGIGFAKETSHNLALLRNLDIFVNSNYPVLVGPSRKRFIGDVLNEPDPMKRLFGTSAVVCKCVQAKVNFIRLHDIYEMKQLITMATALWP